MDLEERLVIKVRLGEEVRKMPIHNEEMTYDELIIMMERVFREKLAAGDEIVVKYLDEDNDLITITDDSDLAFAMESGKVLKLVLTVQNEEEITNDEKELKHIDLKNIRKELQVIRDHTNKLLDKIVHFSNGTNFNVNESGRTSTTGVGDYHAVGGKEFDPLSAGNQTNSTQHVESATSFGSNMRQEDNNVKEVHTESRDTYRPSPTLTKTQNMCPQITSGSPISQMNPLNTSQSVTGALNMPLAHEMGQNLPQQKMGGPNMPQQNMGGQNMPQQNMGGQNVPPQNMGGQNMPPQNMGGQNMAPQNMGGQNMPPQNIGGQNMPPQNIGGQNLPPQNMGGQNMPPQSMAGQNIPQQHMAMSNFPPTSMGGMNLAPSTIGGSNMPPSSFVGHNHSGQNDPSAPKMPGYMGQSRPPFYPPGSIPPQGQPRPSSANFNSLPPNIIGAPVSNSQPLRPHMPPQSYFNPHQQPGVQMFNPQIQQSNAYGGYQQNK